jgi:hypothetical protein
VLFLTDVVAVDVGWKRYMGPVRPDVSVNPKRQNGDDPALAAASAWLLRSC